MQKDATLLTRRYIALAGRRRPSGSGLESVSRRAPQRPAALPPYHIAPERHTDETHESAVDTEAVRMLRTGKTVPLIFMRYRSALPLSTACDTLTGTFL